MEAPLPGHVKSVRVEAFKCHDHFEVEFGCVPPLPTCSLSMHLASSH